MKGRLGNGGEALLRLLDVTKTHGDGAAAVHALQGVSLEVHPGELVAIMGPSGSGKSTLLSIAGVLDAPTSGRVEIGGQATDKLAPTALAELRRRRIGFVFQQYNLVPSLTACENVGLPLELDGVAGGAARSQSLAALEELGLSSLADRFPDQLSGGQQQRIAIARALIGSRRLVLADEPTGALDSATGEGVMDVIRSRCDGGAGGVVVTHNAELAAMANRVVHLKDGLVVVAEPVVSAQASL